MFMVMSVRKETRHKTDDDILNLPMMTEPVMSAVIKLLFHVSFHCFLRKDTELLAVYSALLAVRLTLRHGLSPYSAGAFATSGITELTLGKHHQAVRFGQLSWRVANAEKVNVQHLDSRPQCLHIGPSAPIRQSNLSIEH
jgi:predicted ATPase